MRNKAVMLRGQTCQAVNCAWREIASNCDASIPIYGYDAMLDGRLFAVIDTGHDFLMNRGARPLPRHTAVKTIKRIQTK
jgi:hypothetical protein